MRPGYHAPVALLSPPGAEGFDDLDEQWLRSRPGVKWAAADDGVLPGWVADMDFPAPRPVVEALVRLAEGGDLGHSTGSEVSLLEEKWAARMATRYRWQPAPGQLRVLSDTVQAVRVLIELASSQGDGVLMLTPAYPNFVRALEEMGRRLLAVQAVPGEANWAFDLDAAAAAAREAKVLLLVNPHNPTGRMLDRAELAVPGFRAISPRPLTCPGWTSATPVSATTRPSGCSPRRGSCSAPGPASGRAGPALPASISPRPPRS